MKWMSNRELFHGKTLIGFAILNFIEAEIEIHNYFGIYAQLYDYVSANKTYDIFVTVC